MKNDDEIVEGRAIARFHSSIVGNKRRGDVIRTTLEHARHLTEIGVAEFPRPKKPAGPTERKPAGPGEKKAEEANAVKKSSGALTTGRSIDSPSSSAPGRGIRSLSSAAVRRWFSATGSRGFIGH
jgi:hypothetical protein